MQDYQSIWDVDITQPTHLSMVRLEWNTFSDFKAEVYKSVEDYVRSILTDDEKAAIEKEREDEQDVQE